MARVDAAGDGSGHATIFELVEAAARGGKDEDGQACVADDEHFHLAAEAGGVPFVVFAVHRELRHSGAKVVESARQTCTGGSKDSGRVRRLENRWFLDTVTASGQGSGVRDQGSGVRDQGSGIRWLRKSDSTDGNDRGIYRIESGATNEYGGQRRIEGAGR